MNNSDIAQDICKSCGNNIPLGGYHIHNVIEIPTERKEPNQARNCKNCNVTFFVHETDPHIYCGHCGPVCCVCGNPLETELELKAMYHRECWESV